MNMRIPEQEVKAVLDRADIADVISRYLPLEKKGKEYVAVCPFHDDHDPSMRISPDKQIYKCFACGAGGNALTFVQKYEKISFTDAVVKVASFIHYPLHIENQPEKAKEQTDPKKPLYEVLDLFTSYCRYELSSKDGIQAREYLASRKFAREILEEFEIGYAPQRNMVTAYLQARIKDIRKMEQTGLVQIGTENLLPVFDERITIPIHDAHGKPVGYTARILPGNGRSSKYINTTQTPLYDKGKLVFNYHRASRYCRQAGRVILCEGAMDVIGLAKAGIKEGIANLGTACTPEQLQLIARLQVPVVVFYDQDAAGQKAAWNFGQKAMAAGIRFSVVRQSEAKDPDDIFIEKGAKALADAVNSTVSFAEFAYDYLQSVYILKNYEDKKAYARQMEQIIYTVLEPWEQQPFFERLKALTGFTFEVKKPARIQNSRPGKTGSQRNGSRYSASSLPPVLPAFKGRIQAEKAVLWVMIANESFIAQYSQEVGFFSDSTCSKLYLYIKNAYKNSREIDPVALEASIEEEEVRHLLVELAEWPDYTEVMDSLYEDSIMKIKLDTISSRIGQINLQIAAAQQPEDKIKLVNEKLELLKRQKGLYSRKVV